MNREVRIATLIIAVSVTWHVPVYGVTINLDFDSVATGANIINTPLATPFGSISSINAELVVGTTDLEFNAAGAFGNKIDHLGSPRIAELNFSFDVASIRLIYGGNIGDISIQTLGQSNNLLSMFYQASTNVGQPAGPITLNGPGIRKLQWFETNGNFAPLDNLEISVASTIPEPASIMIWMLGTIGVALSRRNNTRG